MHLKKPCLVATLLVSILAFPACQKGRVARLSDSQSTEPTPAAFEIRWIGLDLQGLPRADLAPHASWPARAVGGTGYAAILGEGPLAIGELAGTAVQLPASLEGREILSIRYSHAVNCGRTDCAKRVDHERALYSQETKSWWIPFDGWLKGIESSLSPRRPETLELEVGLAGNGMRVIRLTVALAGGMPSVSTAVLPGSVPTADPNAFARHTAAQGWGVSRERLSNPSARPLLVAIRAADAGNLRQRLRIDHVAERCIDGSNVFQKYSERPSFSQATFGMSTLRVYRSNGPEDRDALRWSVIELAPGESVDVEWIARPSTHVGSCATLSAKVTLTCRSWSGTLTRETDTYWLIVGALMSGHFPREIRVADAEVPRLELLADTPAPNGSDFANPSLAQITGQEGRGTIEGTSEDYSCQGIF